MPKRLVTALLCAAVGGAAGCAGAAHSAPPGGTTARLGAAGCHPASPLSLFNGGFPQVQGTGHGASLWGLLMSAHPMPFRVGDQEKIVWRMTGTGPLTLVAISPSGAVHRPFWGPAAHDGSNWNKPGEEWGSGYVFTSPGCWDLRATRGSATGDVWIRIVAR